MYPVSSQFLEALRGSHSIYVRVDVERAGVVILPDVAVDSGSVRVDGTSLVRRSVSCVLVDETGDGALGDELLTPGTDLRVFRGVRYPSGRVESVPLGLFRIEDADEDVTALGHYTVEGGDYMTRVIAATFQTPRAITSGVTIPTMIASLVTDAIPGAVVGDTTRSISLTPSAVVWEESRADALVDLSKSIGSEIFVKADGTFSIESPKTVADAADWVIDSGARGVLLGGNRSTSIAAIVNSWIVSSAPTDGTAPVYAVVEDTDPASPTRVAGPTGRRSKRYSSPLLTTVAQCQRAGRTLLSKSLRLSSTLAIQSLVNPALDAGDRIDVFLPDGSTEKHVVASFDVSLTPGGGMSIATRTAPVVGSYVDA